MSRFSLKNLPDISWMLPLPEPPTLPRVSIRRRSREDLINAESRLGSTLFGDIPTGVRREFFHDKDNIWIWHEAWTDQSGQKQSVTVRYEVRPEGIFKKVAAGTYHQLEGDELENFRRAAHAYLDLIKRELYPGA